MAEWVLIACLKQLQLEFNRIAPARSKASDGSIGDTAHQHSVSDHNPDETGSVPIHDADRTNEVHAIDVDNNLRASGLTMEEVVQFLLGRCRSGAERRLRYIIYNRRIWSASSGWVQKAYTGPSAHTEHAHFSASYDSTLEASTASWHLEDLMALSADDKKWIDAELDKRFAALTKTLESYVGDVVDRWTATGDNTVAKADPKDTNPQITVKSALYYIGATVAQVRAKLAGLDVVDDADAKAIAAAIPSDLAAQVVAELKGIIDRGTAATG